MYSSIPSLTSRRLDFLAAIYQLQDSSQLSGTIFKHLPLLVPGDNVMIGNHNANLRIMMGILLSQPFTRSHFLAEANETGLLKEHPFWEVILDPREPLKVLSEMTNFSDWKKNPFYAEILHEDRVRDHINVEFGQGLESFTTVGIIRSRVGFTEEEKATMRFVRPHLMQAFSNAAVVEQFGLCEQAASGSLNTAAITPRGEWVHPHCRRKLRQLLGEGDSHVLRSLEHWLLWELDAMNRGQSSGSKEGWSVLLNGSLLRFCLRRDPTNLSYKLVYWFTDELNAEVPKNLTAREREILSWVREGKTNQEVAIALGVSVQTVKFHMKQIFKKLQVDTRVAAVRALERGPELTNEPALK